MNREEINFEKAEKMVSLLKEGYFNILFDYEIKRWDDNTIGAKDSGCIGFPLCGSNVESGCVFQEGSEFERMLLCPFAKRPLPSRGGCWWDCQIEELNKEQKLGFILAKVDELEKWLDKHKNDGGYWKYSKRGGRI